MGLAGAPFHAESSSTTKKSLYGLHTHSGYSLLRKLVARLNDRALLGVLMRSCSMTGSLAVAPPSGSGQPGALGRLLPLAARQSAGTPLVPARAPAFWKSTNGGLVCPVAAALPVESTV